MPDPIKALHRLQDAAVEDLLATSEGDLRREAEEDGEDFDAIASQTRATINAAIQKAKEKQ